MTEQGTMPNSLGVEHCTHIEVKAIFEDLNNERRYHELRLYSLRHRLARIPNLCKQHKHALEQWFQLECDHWRDISLNENCITTILQSLDMDIPITNLTSDDETNMEPSPAKRQKTQ